MKPLQIVLDTNVVVAGLRSRRGASFRLISQIGLGQFELNLSVPLVLEYEDVLLRSHAEMGLTPTHVANFLDYLCFTANLHEVYFLWRPLLRDPKDDMVLELAVTARCPYIVTYNKRDFAGVEEFGIQILNAQEFIYLLDKRS